TEICDIDRVGDRDPDYENNQEQNSQRRYGADRRRFKHVESTRGRCVEPGFPAAAQFIEAKRGDRTDQGEAAGQRIKQRQDRVAESKPCQGKANNRINYAKEHGVGRHWVEIVGALRQGVLQVSHTDFSDRRLGWTATGADQNVWVGHASPPETLTRMAWRTDATHEDRGEQAFLCRVSSLTFSRHLRAAAEARAG